jgi:hypothetical protein
MFLMRVCMVCTEMSVLSGFAHYSVIWRSNDGAAYKNDAVMHELVCSSYLLDCRTSFRVHGEMPNLSSFLMGCLER